MVNREEIYKETHYLCSSRIRGHLYSNIANREEADDVFQEIFFDFWQALPKFRFEAAPSTILYVITRRRIIDFLRKKYQHAKSLIPASPDSELDKASLESIFSIDLEPLEILLRLTSGETKTLLLAIKRTRRRMNNA